MIPVNLLIYPQYKPKEMMAPIETKRKPQLLKNMTKEQAKDTGMAMVLICILVGIYFDNTKILFASVILLLINMTVPVLFKPVAVLWFGLSHILGTVMTKVLLTILFFILVTPMGLFRKSFGSDSLKIKEWKADQSSVFETRNHEYNSEEMETPY